jgi:transposase
MPPAYVRPYIKRQKNDAADAEAICEAVTRANMRFVETKTTEQQSFAWYFIAPGTCLFVSRPP